MKVQKLFIILFIIFLLFLTGKAITMLSANLSFYHTFQLKELWKKNQELTNKKQYIKALTAIDAANKKHPNNPQYLVTQGLVLEWGGISELFSKQDQQQNLINAKQYYLKATILRPTWPVTWSTLAMLKWRLNEIDQELIEYLLKADKYGKNIIDVRQTWVDIGLFLYQSKSSYSPLIIKGLRRHTQLMLLDHQPWVRRSAIKIIRRHNAEDRVCKWVRTYRDDTSRQQKALCK